MRKSCILGLVTGLMLVVGPAAHASIRDLSDAAGDVMRADNYQQREPVVSPVGTAEGDVVFARIRHTATQVVIYMRFRELSVPKQYAEFQYQIEGNNHQSMEAGIATRHGDPQGYSYANRDWTQRTCPNAHRVNYAADSVSFRFWRGCLKNPKYVRVNAVAWQHRIPREGPIVITDYYDNPAREGGTIGEQGEAWTPWVVTD